MLPSKPGWLAIHQAAWYGQDACLRVLLSGRFRFLKIQLYFQKQMSRPDTSYVQQDHVNINKQAALQDKDTKSEHQ